MGRLPNLKSELEGQLEAYTSVDIGTQSSTGGSNILELKLKALILDTIHFIDLVDQLLQENIRNTNGWTWQKQLRFYLEKGLYRNIKFIKQKFKVTFIIAIGLVLFCKKTLVWIELYLLFFWL